MRADTHRGPEHNRSTSEAEYIDAALTFALSQLHLAPHGRAIHMALLRPAVMTRSGLLAAAIPTLSGLHERTESDPDRARYCIVSSLGFDDRSVVVARAPCNGTPPR